MMGLIESGIDRVRAFKLAAGVGRDGRSVEEPLSVLVKWRSGHEGKLHQVYVNGEFAGVTSDCEQRMLVVGGLSSWSSCLRVEVFAVDVSEAHIDFGSELDDGGQVGRVEIGWIRGMSLPYEGMALVHSDGEVVSSEIDLWSAWQDKGGFGLGRFGAGDFGYEGSAAVGFGKGLFGGEFGFDSDEVRWVSGLLESGGYGFTVKVRDALGNEDSGVESGDVVVVGQGAGAEAVRVESYDIGSGELVIGVE